MSKESFLYSQPSVQQAVALCSQFQQARPAVLAGDRKSSFQGLALRSFLSQLRKNSEDPQKKGDFLARGMWEACSV